MAGRRLTPSALRAQIASGALDPIYLILGKDRTEAASLLADFAQVIDEDVRPFNVERLHGGEAAATAAAIVDSARTLPWVSARRIIIVMQADRLLAPKRDSEAAARDLELLEIYIRAPQPHAVLVLVADAVDGRRRETKLLLKEATVVECGGDADARDPAAWIRRHVAEAGGRIDAAAVRLLAERLGHDIGRLRADLDRLLLYVGPDRPVTSAAVEEVAGSQMLSDPWAIRHAIESGSARQALAELHLLLTAGTPPLQVLGQLRWIVSKSERYPPGRLPGSVEALLRTDLDLKMSAGDPRVLLERLVVELCEGVKPAAARPASVSRRPPPATPSQFSR